MARSEYIGWFGFPIWVPILLYGEEASLHAQLNAPQTIPPTFPILSSWLSFSDSLVQRAYRVNVLGIFIHSRFFFGGILSLRKNLDRDFVFLELRDFVWIHTILDAIYSIFST